MWASGGAQKDREERRKKESFVIKIIARCGTKCSVGALLLTHRTLQHECRQSFWRLGLTGFSYCTGRKPKPLTSRKRPIIVAEGVCRNLIVG
jgi:hypothetical protein